MKSERQMDALDHVRHWSSYLLVTAVASLGWAATSPRVILPEGALKVICIWSLALSVVFGVATLALIPLVAEQGKADDSVYTATARVSVSPFSRRPVSLYLKQVCLPQQVLFVIGILAYAISAAH